jgi:hypothetical protein
MTTSYGTVLAADTYHADRNNVAWAALDGTAKAAALLTASEALDRLYGSLFSGSKTAGWMQDREWPRIDAVTIYGDAIASNVIPLQVDHATYELALRSGTGTELLPDFVAADVLAKARVEGAVSVEYRGSGTADDSQPVFPMVTAILNPLLTGSGDNGGFSSLTGSRVRV